MLFYAVSRLLTRSSTRTSSSRSDSRRLQVLELESRIVPDALSIDTAGIRSKQLASTGNGVTIGQIEPGRPGKTGHDDADWVHVNVRPEDVFQVDQKAPKNQPIDTHAIGVAGVMIDDGDPTIQLPAGAPGVAKQAKLLSAGLRGGKDPDADFPKALRNLIGSSGIRVGNFWSLKA